MVRTIIFAALITFIGRSSASAQSYQADSVADHGYLDAVRQFIAYMARTTGDSAQPFFLEDSVSPLEGSKFLNGCLNDTATFTVEERQQIRSWSVRPPLQAWTPDIAGSIRLIRKDTIRAIFSRKHMDGWNYYYHHFGASFNTFGCPLFLRHYTWCLFYSGNHCGWLCGGGQLALYKKEGGHWVFVKDWGSWIS